MEEPILYDNGHVGLLWQDKKGKLVDILRQGKRRFEERTQSQATSCRMNPFHIPAGQDEIEGIRLVKAPEMYPGYFLFVRGGEA